MILKIHGLLYRLFGINTKYAKEQEQIYINSLPDNLSNFDRTMRLSVWKVDNWFYKSHTEALNAITCGFCETFCGHGWCVTRKDDK